MTKTPKRASFRGCNYSAPLHVLGLEFGQFSCVLAPTARPHTSLGQRPRAAAREDWQG